MEAYKSPVWEHFDSLGRPSKIASDAAVLLEPATFANATSVETIIHTPYIHTKRGESSIHIGSGAREPKQQRKGKFECNELMTGLNRGHAFQPLTNVAAYRRRSCFERSRRSRLLRLGGIGAKSAVSGLVTRMRQVLQRALQISAAMAPSPPLANRRRAAEVVKMMPAARKEGKRGTPAYIGNYVRTYTFPATGPLSPFPLSPPSVPLARLSLPAHCAVRRERAPSKPPIRRHGRWLACRRRPRGHVATSRP